MTKSYSQIMQQIDGLKQQADKVRRKEVDGVVARIRQAISVYNLTADDLGFGSKVSKPAAAKPVAAAPIKRRQKRKNAAPAKPAAVVKFRNDSGGIWGGRGKRPDWLRAALASGKQLSDFLVK